jgi:hypothetical protein
MKKLEAVMKAGEKIITVLILVLTGFIVLLTTANAGTDQFKKHVVMDRQGLGIEAYRLLIPEDWRFDGGVQWLSNSLQLTKVAFKVSHPDGITAYEVFPEFVFFYSADPNMNAIYAQTTMVQPPVYAAVYLEQMFIPSYRGNLPGLRIIRKDQLPELAQTALMNYQIQLNQNPYLAQMSAGVNMQFDAASVSIEYQAGKHIIEETLSAIVGYSSAGIVTNWGPMRQTSFRTIKGQKNDMAPVLRVINDSYQANPLWEYKISQIYYMMVQQQKKVLESIGQLSRYISQTNDQISEGLYQSYKQRDAIYDGAAKNWSEAIRGVDSYFDPINKSEVEVPTIYEKAWTDGNDYIFSTDPGYDPNRSAGPNWTLLQKAGK